MRSVIVAAALLLIPAMAAAQETPTVAIAVEPIGANEDGVVARVFFRFANPRAITEAGLFLQGSFIQAGQVPRHFNFTVLRDHDQLIWDNVVRRNGKVVRRESWALLPDRRNELATIHTFAEGTVEIDVGLVLAGYRGGAPTTVAEGRATFTLSKANVPVLADEDGAVVEEEPPRRAGAVTLGAPRRDEASGLYLVSADVHPPVERVEFWIENKKVLARNAPPYVAELDLAPSAQRTVRAVGYDAAGCYVDADAVTASDALAVMLTRVATDEGVCHFKLSVQNPAGTPLKSAALYAGDRKLHQWDRPPFAVSVPCATLDGAGFVRASVVDNAGNEASDRLRLQ